MAVPPHIECSGIRSPAAKPLNGIYEYYCVAGDRPCYRQVGVSSGNFLWYAEDTKEGPMWVVTPKDQGAIGDSPQKVVARSFCMARWPWEVDGWTTVGGGGVFVDAPRMSFSYVVPAAELLLHRSDPATGVVVTERFRRAGHTSGRVSFRQVGDFSKRLFYMPGLRQWLLAIAKEGEGIDSVLARSVALDEVSWASLWPWSVEAHGWETPSCKTTGLISTAEILWGVDRNFDVRLASPVVCITGTLILDGVYDPRGMINGRVLYLRRIDATDVHAQGPVCLWFAEDRGQWVMTGPDQLGDSRVVRARINSRAWWPWEAQHGGTTSPEALGSAAFAAAPPWQGGAAMLASSRGDWEELVEGGLRPAPAMVVEALFPKCLRVSGAPASQQAFLGMYEYEGIISSRPYFVRRREKDSYYGYALWYAADCDHWVITADFRFMESSSTEARVEDSAFLPWEVDAHWQVSDSSGGFCADWILRAEPMESNMERDASKEAEAADQVADEVESEPSGMSPTIPGYQPL